MFPTLIHIGNFYIATYGVLVAAGYMTGIWILKSQAAAMGLSEDRFWKLVYYLFGGAIGGGKLLFIALNWHAFSSGQMSLIGDFRYGFVFFGGFIGAVIMGFVFCRGDYSEFVRLADYFGAALPVGHAIGRLGCLAAGCCYGRPTTVPWAVRFTDERSLVAQALLGVPLHPTQLYEALGNVLIAAGVFQLLKRVRAKQLPQGSAFYSYVLFYAVLRFVIEFYRGDDRGGFWHGLSPSQWIAIAVAVCVLVTLERSGLWRKRSA